LSVIYTGCPEIK